MRRIEIDDEVYAALAEHAVGFQQPNDVLRALLGLAADASPTTTAAAVRSGRLAPLLAVGLLKPGDELVHRQVRKGQAFTGRVEADGWIRTDRGRYAEPSPALRDLVGSQIDGWRHWWHLASGKSLRQLRAESGGRPRGRAG
ncbi:hypothetical protein [Vallicoccus soli]|nr:hypothetical protein [Vallicoccus soli]